MRSMRSIVFSGGGIRCLSFAGVLSAIENIHGPGCWNQVREVSGASGGAIFAFIIAANISAKKVIDVLKTDEIKDSIREMRVGRSYLDHFRAIAEERSVCGFKPLQNMVTKIVQLKFSSNITMHEFYRQTGKRFTCPVYNLTLGQVEYMDYYTSADARVVDVIRASMSIPIIFPPVRIGNFEYLDGGISDNMPLTCVREPASILFRMATVEYDPHNLSGYLSHLVQVLHVSLQKRHRFRCLEVCEVNSDFGLSFYNFDVTAEQIESCLCAGRDSYYKFYTGKMIALLIKFSVWSQNDGSKLHQTSKQTGPMLYDDCAGDENWPWPGAHCQRKDESYSDGCFEERRHRKSEQTDKGL